MSLFEKKRPCADGSATPDVAAATPSAAASGTSATPAGPRAGRTVRLQEVFGSGNILLVLALSLSFTSTWLLNAVGYPALDPFCPQAQIAAPIVGTFVAFALAIVSQYRPNIFAQTQTLVVTFASIMLGTALIFLAAAIESPSLAIFAACLRWVACILRDIVLAFALINLSAHTCLGVLLCGYCLRYVWISLFNIAPVAVRVAGLYLCSPIGLFILWYFAQPALRRVACAGAPIDLSITNPMSFLPLRNRMFVAVIFFHAALGFSVSFDGPDQRVQVVSSLIVFVLLLIYAAVREVHSIDSLYSFAFMLTLGGLVFVPIICGGVVGMGAVRSVCGSFFEVSASLYALVLWYLIARIGARSPSGALPVLCMIRAARGAGMAIGFGTGTLTSQLEVTNPLYAAVLAAGMIFVFAAYNFMFARSFSFDQTVRSVQPYEDGADAQPASGANAQAVGEEGAEEAAAAARSLEACCERVAAGCRLTARETEVLHLLARGRNAAYIQETLGLTRNTVKSYVADVYRKLDVHSHQELIDVVEAWPQE